MNEPESAGTNGASQPSFQKMKPAVKGKKRIFPLELKKSIAMRVKSGESIMNIAKQTGAHSTQILRWSRGEGLGPMGGGYSTKPRHAARADKPSGTRAQARARKDKQPARKQPANSLSKPVKDAIYYLERAEAWTYQALREEKIDRIDTAHDYARQALRELVKLLNH